MDSMMPKRQELEEIAASWLFRGWRERDLDVVADLHAEYFIDHSAVDRRPDNEGFRRGMETLFESFPDFSATVEKLIVDEATSEVAVHWSASATCQAPFAGFDADGQPVHFNGIEIIRVEEGRITDRWGEWNWEDIMAQLRGSRYRLGAARFVAS